MISQAKVFNKLQITVYKGKLQITMYSVQILSKKER
jgi:hypothetical protein